MRAVWRVGRYGFLAAPIAFVAMFLLVPLALTGVLSFWKRAGFKLEPAFTLASYEAFFSGVRLSVLEKSLVAAVVVTVLGLLVAYPIAWFLSNRVSRRHQPGLPVPARGAVRHQPDHPQLLARLAARPHRADQLRALPPSDSPTGRSTGCCSATSR